ncbi:MAG: C10 family peptidase [Rikenellaceae bacterium]|nr:C10 family peptidase [Rikenellaceae bacterium]
MREFGYNNSTSQDFAEDLTSLINLLYATQPVIVYGYNESTGHMWIVDGYGYWNTKKPDKNGLFYTYERYEIYHCNFGWGGNADGWYISGLFETNSRVYKTTYMGDKNETSGFNYYLDINYIQYDAR